MSRRYRFIFVFVLVLGAAAALIGCGGGRMGVSQNPPNPNAAGQLVLSPSTLKFGTVAVRGSKKLRGTITARSSNLVVSSAEWNGAGFLVNGITFPATVPAGQSIAFIVTFSPATAGNASGSIRFLSNAVNSPNIETLAGVGSESPAQHAVTLSWKPSISAVMGYNLYRRTNSGNYAKLNSSPLLQTNYTDTSVQSGATYFYVATSLAANFVESAHSNETEAVIP
jgi:Abnormal spindle-like microcephaly-assoc'd, ASPM-SPD-2-Hydin